MKQAPRSFLLLLAVAAGFAIAGSFLPGGFDAFYFFMRSPRTDTVVPAQAYLFTVPLSWLGWPNSWQVLIFLTILGAGLAALAWDNRNWWVAVFSAPMVWNIWLGQIEIFSIAGLLVAAFLIKRRVHPAWVGLMWLLFSVKPQVGLGPLLLVSWWVGRDRGFKALLWGLPVAGLTLAFTFLFWPGWVERWLVNVLYFQPNPTGAAAIWPYGLVFIPLAVLPREVDRKKRLRMIAAATLLASPYFILYHISTLMVLVSSPLAFLLSWALVYPASALAGTWRMWGWVLPATILLVDFTTHYQPILARFFHRLWSDHKNTVV
ncbi:MAG TPA: hypothetical protein DEQ80_05635 [Anaerolinea thermolimosa]|uniref:DUF2029 domain-containing protein n=1 Tax=Anaerolinea thermolimosa TaxID=229919 RepID=A0A3D1JFG2_9CHLR|nr:hypothetical protein [Anaerolinea thermolimosa]